MRVVEMDDEELSVPEDVLEGVSAARYQIKRTSAREPPR
jgi:hypothetical protein